MNLSNEFQTIREWAQNKGIAEGGDLKTQTVKLLEEAGELAKAVLTNNTPEIVDAIGDCVVVLANLALLANRDYLDGVLPQDDAVESEFEANSLKYDELVSTSHHDAVIHDATAISIEFCINSAYNVIAKRTGKMVDGSFVKDVQ